MSYETYLVRTESGQTILIPVDELLRILLSGQMPDGSTYEGVRVQAVSGSEFTVTTSGGSIAVGVVPGTEFPVIDFTHSEIHKGNQYFLSSHSLLNDGDTVEFVVTTPDSDTHAHMLFDVQSEKTLEIEVYEGASGISGGSTYVPWNNNRNSPNTSSITVLKDPTVVSDGTLIDNYKWGSNKNGGRLPRDQEIVLAANENYLFRFTSSENSNIIWYRGHWHEYAE